MKMFKNVRWDHKLLMVLLLIAVLLNFIQTAYAADNGNAWVYDETNVISEETENYISELNELVFINYKNKPQLAFMVIDKLPYNIDSYKLDMFNEFGVGTAEENCGMLFVLAIEDREYGFEIGDGFAKGSLLRSDLEKDFITVTMKESLKNGDYDSVVLNIAKYLGKVMADEDNGTYLAKENALIAQKEQQKAEAEAMEAENFEKLKMLLWVVLSLGVCTFIICIIVNRVNHQKRNRIFDKLCEEYKNQISMFNLPSEEVLNYTKLRMQCYDNDSLEDSFPHTLHDLFISTYCKMICDTDSARRNLYVDEFKKRNGIVEFKSNRITSVEKIRQIVDEAEERRLKIIAENKTLITQFWSDHKDQIKQKAIVKPLLQSVSQLLTDQRRLNINEIEKHFQSEMKRLSFELEIEKFLQEHQSETHNRDFNKTQFTSELMSTNNYKQYRYDRAYNNLWMYHFLIAHTTNNKRIRIRREEEERARQQRQARQNAINSVKRTNTSFGTSFGGGFSSGGGFKGKW